MDASFRGGGRLTETVRLLKRQNAIECAAIRSHFPGICGYVPVHSGRFSASPGSGTFVNVLAEFRGADLCPTSNGFLLRFCFLP